MKPHPSTPLTPPPPPSLVPLPRGSILSDELLRFLLSRITTISSLPTLGPGSAPPGSSASTASGAAIRHQWTKVSRTDINQASQSISTIHRVVETDQPLLP
jgi:hypothetical protein